MKLQKKAFVLAGGACLFFSSAHASLIPIETTTITCPKATDINVAAPSKRPGQYSFNSQVRGLNFSTTLGGKDREHLEAQNASGVAFSGVFTGEVGKKPAIEASAKVLDIIAREGEPIQLRCWYDVGGYPDKTAMLVADAPTRFSECAVNNNAFECIRF
jgi:hypothetical protein